MIRNIITILEIFFSCEGLLRSEFNLVSTQFYYTYFHYNYLSVVYVAYHERHGQVNISFIILLIISN